MLTVSKRPRAGSTLTISPSRRAPVEGNPVGARISIKWGRRVSRTAFIKEKQADSLKEERRTSNSIDEALAEVQGSKRLIERTNSPAKVTAWARHCDRGNRLYPLYTGSDTGDIALTVSCRTPRVYITHQGTVQDLTLLM